MSKHTPGPWRVEAYSERDQVRYYVRHLPEVELGMPLIKGIEREADARLLAAAPELLEALRLFFATRQAGKYLGNGDFVVDGEDYLKAYETARAILARAEGKDE